MLPSLREPHRRRCMPQPKSIRSPVWIVSTKGNVDRARAVSVVDDRAEVVRANAIPSRAETGKLAAKQAMASD